MQNEKNNDPLTSTITTTTTTHTLTNDERVSEEDSTTATTNYDELSEVDSMTITTNNEDEDESTTTTTNYVDSFMIVQQLIEAALKVKTSEEKLHKIFDISRVTKMRAKLGLQNNANSSTANVTRRWTFILLASFDEVRKFVLACNQEVGDQREFVVKRACDFLAITIKFVDCYADGPSIYDLFVLWDKADEEHRQHVWDFSSKKFVAKNIFSFFDSHQFFYKLRNFLIKTTDSLSESPTTRKRHLDDSASALTVIRMQHKKNKNNNVHLEIEDCNKNRQAISFLLDESKKNALSGLFYTLLLLAIFKQKNLSTSWFISKLKRSLFTDNFENLLSLFNYEVYDSELKEILLKLKSYLQQFDPSMNEIISYLFELSINANKYEDTLILIFNRKNIHVIDHSVRLNRYLGEEYVYFSLNYLLLLDFKFLFCQLADFGLIQFNGKMVINGTANLDDTTTINFDDETIEALCRLLKPLPAIYMSFSAMSLVSQSNQKQRFLSFIKDRRLVIVDNKTNILNFFQENHDRDIINLVNEFKNFCSGISFSIIQNPIILLPDTVVSHEQLELLSKFSASLTTKIRGLSIMFSPFCEGEPDKKKLLDDFNESLAFLRGVKITGAKDGNFLLFLRLNIRNSYWSFSENHLSALAAELPLFLPNFFIKEECVYPQGVDKISFLLTKLPQETRIGHLMFELEFFALQHSNWDVSFGWLFQVLRKVRIESISFFIPGNSYENEAIVSLLNNVLLNLSLISIAELTIRLELDSHRPEQLGECYNAFVIHLTDVVLKNNKIKRVHLSFAQFVSPEVLVRLKRALEKNISMVSLGALMMYSIFNKPGIRNKIPPRLLTQIANGETEELPDLRPLYLREARPALTS